MKVFITGGTGFVGRNIAQRLASEGHEVTILSRKAPSKPPFQVSERIHFVEGDPTKPQAWQDVAKTHDTFINLAGASIFSRWTEEVKENIRRSRLWTTRNLVSCMAADRETVLVSTSAVGYYGFHGDEVLDESHPPGDDFLATLAKEWEHEALRAQEIGSRVVITRFGIVLGRDMGALPMMARPFKWYLGGPLGKGRQWISWIHIGDLIDAVLFLLNKKDASGPYNLTAPNPIRNADFSRELGRALRRPSWLPAPAFAIRLILGEFGQVILRGQRVIPKRLLEEGFSFRFPNLRDALSDLLT